MKKHLLILTLVFCSAMHCGFAQVTFQKAIGLYFYNNANSVQQTTDGGYIVTGSTFPGGFDHIYLIKSSSAGNLIWTKTYVDLAQGIAGYSVHQTNDEGYIITGLAYHMGAGSVPLHIIKTDAIGDTLWTKIYYQGFLRYWGYSIQQTADSGYIIAGAGSNCKYPVQDSLKAILVKTDQNGDITWFKAYAGIKDNAVYSVQQTNDNGYIMAGHARNTGMDSTDVYLVKTNTYSHLYNWYAVTDTRNIAPEGWRVATDDDWATLADFLGGWEVAGGKMKETGTLHWLNPNTDATNESGFTGLPGGFRYAEGRFVGIVHKGKFGYWWTTAENDAASAWFRGMTCASPYLGRESVSKNYGLSVRCVKDK